MTPIESAALRSGIVAAAAFALFMLVSYLLYPGDAQDRLHAFAAAIDPAFLATLALVAVGIFALQIRGGTRLSAAGRTTRFVRAAIEVALISLAIIVVHECVSAGFSGGFVQFSPRYQARLLEAIVFTAAVIRLALPLLPRFDRMPPRPI